MPVVFVTCERTRRRTFLTPCTTRNNTDHTLIWECNHTILPRIYETNFSILSMLLPLLQVVSTSENRCLQKFTWEPIRIQGFQDVEKIRWFQCLHIPRRHLKFSSTASRPRAYVISWSCIFQVFSNDDLTLVNFDRTITLSNSSVRSSCGLEGWTT
jgi:hypothetical protein